jgi:hypothetical protein
MPPDGWDYIDLPDRDYVLACPICVDMNRVREYDEQQVKSHEAGKITSTVTEPLMQAVFKILLEEASKGEFVLLDRDGGIVLRKRLQPENISTTHHGVRFDVELSGDYYLDQNSLYHKALVYNNEDDLLFFSTFNEDDSKYTLRDGDTITINFPIQFGA